MKRQCAKCGKGRAVKDEQVGPCHKSVGGQHEQVGPGLMRVLIDDMNDHS